MSDTSDKPLLTTSDIELILACGRRRVALLYELKQAILDGDSEREHAIARLLTGLPPESAQP